MGLITIRENKVSFIQFGGDDYVRSGVDGCCCCSVIENLCYDFSVTDHLGNTYTADESDISWTGTAPNATGFVTLGDSFENSTTITISCGPCGLSFAVFKALFVAGCDCTTAFAEVLFRCQGLDDYSGSETFTLEFEDVLVFCPPPCPDPVATVTIAVAKPPC